MGVEVHLMPLCREFRGRDLKFKSKWQLEGRGKKNHFPVDISTIICGAGGGGGWRKKSFPGSAKRSGRRGRATLAMSRSIFTLKHGNSIYFSLKIVK